MQLRTVRRIWQAAFLVLFCYLVFKTAAGAARIGTLGISASFFLEIDPLIALGMISATGELYHVGLWGMLWALVILLSALLFGRAFCSWVCPFGTIHHAVGWITRPGDKEARIKRNAYRPSFALKYLLLVAFLLGALAGSLQVGLLDPLALLHRSLAACLLPVFELGFRALAPAGSHLIYQGSVPLFAFAYLTGAIVLVLLAANIVMPRFFCRVLCPLGALLGIFSRFALFKIVRDENRCTGCGACTLSCEGGCNPQETLRRAECLMCFNCVAECPEGAFSLRFVPPERREVPYPDVEGRRLFLAACFGFLFTPLARLTGAAGRIFSAAAIRPPGARKEEDFLSRCVKCGQCMRVCPTNVLQPALLETGIEGMWTPVLKMRYGVCDIHCTLCTQVCPTGALQRLTPAQRNGLEPYPGRAERMVVKLGTAFVDRGRCLPWAMDRPCVACEEVCPVSPKAISGREAVVTTAGGAKLTLRQPHVDPVLCVGCGACEHVCPVQDLPAIRVSAVGESRSRGAGEADRGFISQLK